MKTSLIAQSLLIACCLSQSSAIYAQESGFEMSDENQQIENLALEELELLEEPESEQVIMTDESIEEELIEASDIDAEMEIELETEIEVEAELSDALSEVEADVQPQTKVKDTVDVSQVQYTRTLPVEGDVVIPTIADAKVFAEFTDALPAVINYYTMSGEEDIINFYENFYGEAITQERKRGRLTVSYFFNQLSVRVVISPQNAFHQVDVMVEELM